MFQSICGGGGGGGGRRHCILDRVFFCSVNFGRSIYSIQRVEIGIIRKPVQRRIWNEQDFSTFRVLGVMEGESCANSRRNFVVFIHIFRTFYQISVNLLKLSGKKLIRFTFRDRGGFSIGLESFD